MAERDDDASDDTAADVTEAASPASPSRKTPPPTVTEVFGTVLPDVTNDERAGHDWREDVEHDRDQQLREDVPPHY